MKKTLSEDTG